MKKIGAYEAKTHLPQLLDRVRQGERFTITKHGQPVAQLVPLAVHDRDVSLKHIANLRQLRASLEKRGVRMSDLLKPGESLRELAHREHRF